MTSKYTALIPIPASQERIMDGLREYTFLTLQQMQRVGVGSYDYIRKEVLPRLTAGNKPFVGCMRMPTLPDLGRLPNVYYLTHFGARYLAELLSYDPSEIRYPNRTPDYRTDFFHRTGTIDVHIAVRRWLERQGYELEFFHRYFDIQPNATKAGGRASLTSLPYGNTTLRPDAVFRATGGGKTRLFAVEYHQHQQVGKVVEQLDRHITLLSKKVIQQKYQHHAANFLLSVYHDAAVMERVQKRLLVLPDVEAFLPLILFNTLERVQAHPNKGWVTADGKAAELLPVLPEDEIELA